MPIDARLLSEQLTAEEMIFLLSVAEANLTNFQPAETRLIATLVARGMLILGDSSVGLTELGRSVVTLVCTPSRDADATSATAELRPVRVKETGLATTTAMSSRARRQVNAPAAPHSVGPPPPAPVAQAPAAPPPVASQVAAPVPKVAAAPPPVRPQVTAETMGMPVGPQKATAAAGFSAAERSFLGRAGDGGFLSDSQHLDPIAARFVDRGYLSLHPLAESYVVLRLTPKGRAALRDQTQGGP